MSKLLKPRERELLAEVLQHGVPPRIDLLLAAEADALSGEQREEICGLIGKEFLRTGLSANDEPNPRGLELESLLDSVSRM